MSFRLKQACLAAAISLAVAGVSFADAPATMPSTGAPANSPPTDAVLAKANPQMKTVLDALMGLKPKPIETLSPQEARLQPSAADAVTQVLQDKGMVAPDKLPPVGMVEMKTIAGPGNAPIPVRVYTPKGDGPFPVIVYFHGGGWVIATLDTYDSSCRGLCSLNDAVVVSVDYRQAPEHKFPAAAEDSYAVFQFVATHATNFNGDPNKIAVVGESAGGNLATDVCLMAEQRGGKMPIHQVLVYPITDDAFDTASYIENANAEPLNRAMMQWFYQQYLNNPGDGANVLASPLRASADQLKALPPATIVLAQIDPLHDDGQQYGEKLKGAGVDVSTQTFDGVTHEFFGMAAVVDQAKAANAFVTGRLKTAFAGK